MAKVDLPEDVAKLLGGLGERCDLKYREIIRDQDARNAAARWTMFREILEQGDARTGTDLATADKRT